MALFELLLAGVSVLVILLIGLHIWLNHLKKRAYEICGHYVCISPPQFPKIPILGNLLGNAIMFLSLNSSIDVWNLITSSAQKHPEGIIYWLFNIPWFVVQELDVIETILLSSETTDKSYVYQLLDTITDGVFSCNGYRWKKLRKKLNLTFSQKQLDMTYYDINEQTEKCINILKKNTNKYINIFTFLTPYFFDTVARTHFGVVTNEQSDRLVQTTEASARVIELTIENRFFKAHNFFMPIFKLGRVSQFIDHIKAEPLNFIRQMIGQRLLEVDIEKSKGVYEDRSKIYYTDLAKEALEELKIKPSLYNLERNTGDVLIAASDTTSVAVSAFFYYISVYPEIQQKIYEEILPIFGDNSTKELTKDDLNKMEYLEMVIKESLRHSAPSGIARSISKELNIGKYTVPKNTNIFIAMKSIHENPKYYEKANEFYPEHFLPEKVKQRPKFAFFPFSFGPRNCPGMAYSYMTMKSITSSVIRNFKLETNIPLKDIKIKMALMQEHTNGYFIKLIPRSDINFNPVI